MSDTLINRLRGQYQVGPDECNFGTRDFSDFIPPISLEAADKIDGLTKQVDQIEQKHAKQIADRIPIDLIPKDVTWPSILSAVSRLKQQRNNADAELGEANDEINLKIFAMMGVVKRRDELAAQLEQIKRYADDADRNTTLEAVDAIWHLVRESPSTSLAQHDQKVADKSAIKAAEEMRERCADFIQHHNWSAHTRTSAANAVRNLPIDSH